MIREAAEEDYAALLAGKAPPDLRLSDTDVAPLPVIAMLCGVAAKVRESFSPTSWLIIEDGEFVGLCSIVKPPHLGVVELGYGIAPNKRRHGYASKALADIAEWARGRSDVVALIAETSTENAASQSVLRANGFKQSGERMDDEDGPLIGWRLNTQP